MSFARGPSIFYKTLDSLAATQLLEKGLNDKAIALQIIKDALSLKKLSQCDMDRAFGAAEQNPHADIKQFQHYSVFKLCEKWAKDTDFAAELVNQKLQVSQYLSPDHKEQLFGKEIVNPHFVRTFSCMV